MQHYLVFLTSDASLTKWEALSNIQNRWMILIQVSVTSYILSQQYHVIAITTTDCIAMVSITLHYKKYGFFWHKRCKKFPSKFQNFVNLFLKLHYKFAPLMIINHTLKKSTAGSSIVDDKKLHFSITTFTLPSLLYIHYITTHHANFFCKSYAYM